MTQTTPRKKRVSLTDVEKANLQQDIRAGILDSNELMSIYGISASQLWRLSKPIRDAVRAERSTEVRRIIEERKTSIAKKPQPQTKETSEDLPALPRGQFHENHNIKFRNMSEVSNRWIRGMSMFTGKRWEEIVDDLVNFAMESGKNGKQIHGSAKK